MTFFAADIAIPGILGHEFGVDSPPGNPCTRYDTNEVTWNPVARERL
jgi:hypothetical protein